MKYFDGIQTVEEVKKLYRKLAHQHHPDKGGRLEDMQALNAEYQQALERLDGSEVTGAEDKIFKYKYDRVTEEALTQAFYAIIEAGIKGEIFIIGKWLWLLETDKEQKDEIKKIEINGKRFRWSGQRSAWYFHTGGWRGRRSNSELKDLAEKYGAEKVARKQRTKIQTA